MPNRCCTSSFTRALTARSQNHHRRITESSSLNLHRSGRSYICRKARFSAESPQPEHLVRMTWYVTDVVAYRTSLAALGEAYRDVMGRNFPTMTLIAVQALAEPDALVEIEATAVIPD